MPFDPNNRIVKLCAEGMEFEGQGKKSEASKLFQQAWNEATSDLDRFIAAHYVARLQEKVEDKLQWDKTALELALRIGDANVKASLPSLYLNVGKCYEDLTDFSNAKEHYKLALSFIHLLPEDGYGKMIRSGIMGGIERLENADRQCFRMLFGYLMIETKIQRSH